MESLTGSPHHDHILYTLCKSNTKIYIVYQERINVGASNTLGIDCRHKYMIQTVVQCTAFLLHIYKV
jgi:hypothetical protein